MHVLSNIWLFLWSYIRTIGVFDVFDILIVAYLIYKLLTVVRRTSASGVFRGILLLLAALWLSSLLKLTLVNYLLRQIIQIGVLALIILFQPELRRILDTFGNRNWRRILGRRSLSADERTIETIVSACCDLARDKTGALVVFERSTGLREFTASGTVLSADITVELLLNIFFVNTPLHDGAVLIADGRLLAASCMLPLSSNSSLPRDLGMRHRAAVGITERTDAIAVVVSEETGSISVAENGMIKRHLPRDAFDKILRNALLDEKTTAANPVDFILDTLGIRRKGARNEKKNR
ncbi:MAG: diadenylate cyclase CdaA [Oscillospiraceae bacterium]|jgi:diadenylate cyclase|nr:diadenylate cyclase CdaA [Oscillospiraceae bacterium]